VTIAVVVYFVKEKISKFGLTSLSNPVSLKRRRRTLQGHYFFRERQTMSPNTIKIGTMQLSAAMRSGQQGIPWEVFKTARKPISEAHNRQETPLFARSIERHALRDK